MELHIQERKSGMYGGKRVLVIIPAYNESANIVNTVQTLQNENIGVDYLVINDCSNDNTLDIIKKLGCNYVNLPINLGIGGGMQTGYKYAYRNGYDIAVQMDGDGQHLPGYIKNLLEPILNGESDLVVGSRFLNRVGFQSSKMRRIGINFLSGLIQLCCGIKIKDVTSGFRAANRKAIELFAQNYAQDYPEPESLVTCAISGIRITEVPVIMTERNGGASSITSMKSIYYMIKVSAAIILRREASK